MKVLSLKLQDQVFEEVEKVVHILKTPRNAYINDALKFYNAFHKRQHLKAKLKKESAKVREISLETLHEMEKVVDGFDRY